MVRLFHLATTTATMTDQQELLASLLRIHRLIDSHAPFAGILEEGVSTVGRLLASDVCSIYLLSHDGTRLVLEATRGLAASSIGRVSLPLGQGLVGRSFRELKPVASADVFSERDFAYLPETEEERYRSLLAVPILYQGQPMGVLVIQHAETHAYRDYEVQFLEVIAREFAPLIQRARFHTQFDARFLEGEPEKTVRLESAVYKGKPASPGIAWGDVSMVVLGREEGSGRQSDLPLNPDEERQAFAGAVERLKTRIAEMKKEAEAHLSGSELAIFDVYHMILDGEGFPDQVVARIESGECAELAVETVIETLAEPLLSSEDVYLRERAFDLQDLARQLFVELSGQGGESSRTALELPAHSPHILVFDRLPIFDLVRRVNVNTRGLFCEEGGTTGHAAILAQAMGIPAVMGIRGLLRRLLPGDSLLIDGDTGVVIANPDEHAMDVYRRKKARREKLSGDAVEEKWRRPIVSPYPFEVGATVGDLAQIKMLSRIGADSVGLYRTEIPFLIRRHLPTEEEQFDIYAAILREAKGLPVTFRILDVGGDKPLRALSHGQQEENPALGWRAIRLVLARPEVFEMQLRALLRASCFGPVRLLFPMISSVEEVELIKVHLSEARAALRARGERYAEAIPLGAMIEIPAAVAIAPELMAELDFGSIGTNDLIQYTLATDRNNPHVSAFYDPFHPAVLRAIMQVVEAGHRAGKPIRICGEMASDLRFYPFFLAARIDGVSVNPIHIPRLKRLLLSGPVPALSLDALLRAKSSREVQALLDWEPIQAE